MNPAILLDRDGVINKNLINGVLKWDEFQFLPESLKAMKILATLPYKIIITTNQPFVERGLLPEHELRKIHQNMKTIIEKNKGRIDAVYYCPHEKAENGGNCRCRKPKPGMHLQAAKEHNIDLEKSIYVGDSTRDIKLANNLKETSILVKTGRAGKDKRFPDAKPDYIEDNLLTASKRILKIFSQRN